LFGSSKGMIDIRVNEMNYCVVLLAVFELRRQYPEMPRPCKAMGYPFSTGIALTGSGAFLVAAVIQDWRSGLTAVAFLALCLPAYRWAARSRKRQTGILIQSGS